ncbi:PilN domain-containing protein [Arenimonas sp.]|uniref:PilN domain-containing protein n=1 Tax=Arenimonas sp. TaxID=1872635 RepID=UPI0039E2F711
MARINLLPWRAERRKQRLQEFYSMLGMAALAGALISLMIWLYYSGQIEGQKNRNNYLSEQIKVVDKQIAEIKELDKKKERLLRRKEVIEELQASRSQMVHLFDELARTIADGTRITAIKQSGQTLTLEGRAQSNARVSSYMRNLDASGWMGKSDLSIIEAKSGDKGLPYEFTLKVSLKNPSDQAAKAADEAAAAATAAPADGTAPATTAPAAAAPATAPAPTATPAAESQSPAAPTGGEAK